jgi:cytochrome P450
MGRTIWEQPDDFHPERFVDKNVSAYTYTVFNAGPRSFLTIFLTFRLCLGMNMAYIEGVLALVGLLSNFDFEYVSGGTYDLGLTMPMKDGLHVKVKKRTNKT